VLRPFRARDKAAVDALLDSAWPDDPGLREISAVHGEDLDSDERWRRTLVCVAAGDVVGAGTLLGSARHPARYFVVLLVAAEFRRRGIATALLVALASLGDGRPLLARIRETDSAGAGFLSAAGFGFLMRSRVGVVDPRDPRVQAWAASASAASFDSRLSRRELALAHEEAYAAEHADWSPTTRRPLEESMRLFCGDSWLPETARAVRRQGRVAAVGALHGPPLASSDDELFLVAGTAAGDDVALRAVVAAELELAHSLGARVSIEADEANACLSQILLGLPAVLEPALLLLSTDVSPLSARRV
jgi:GNAT superfamily N-acetyltransferase